MKIVNEGYVIETKLNGEEILKHIEKLQSIIFELN